MLFDITKLRQKAVRAFANINPLFAKIKYLVL